MDLPPPDGASTLGQKGILGFRIGVNCDMSVGAPSSRKNTYPVQQFGAEKNIRIVPGGSSVRQGAYLGKNVTCMPPMYINAGAYVDDGTMVDSHALVGSCAQVGKACHISAASQIGGVLEPVGALPVVIEDEVLIGGNCGVYEGTIVKRRAVLPAPSDRHAAPRPVHNTIHRAGDDDPLVVPEGAVVIAARAPLPTVRARTGASPSTPRHRQIPRCETDTRIQLGLLDSLRALHSPSRRRRYQLDLRKAVLSSPVIRWRFGSPWPPRCASRRSGPTWYGPALNAEGKPTRPRAWG